MHHQSTLKAQGRGRARQLPPRRVRRRSGIAIVYTALGLSSFLGVTALVVDLGNLYTKRAQAQRAADAAALAGALELSQGADAARNKAIEYALLNGYDSTAAATNVIVTVTMPDSVRVRIDRREPLYFLPAVAALLGSSATTSTVGANATAVGTFPSAAVGIDLGGGSEYGATGGFANPSVFGPNSRYEYGDAYSPMFLKNGVTPNEGTADDPRGANFPGFEYKLNIAPNYKSLNGDSGEVQFEIFDPDSYTANSSNVNDWDEAHYGDAGQPHIATRTQYTLYAPDGTKIAEAIYGEDAASNLQWITPDGFKFNIDNHGGPGEYKLVVKALEGTDENGFQMRAGRPHEGLTAPTDEATWGAEYNNGGTGNGTSITATGKVPLNFTRSGTIEIKLGYVPPKAAGGTIFINKFDTDVGAKSISYHCDALPNQRFPGVLASNGAWGSPPDTVDIPSDYNGGNWFATYEAAEFDTSCWTMNYSIPGTPGTKGIIKLVE